jgi:hypothetical protein
LRDNQNRLGAVNKSDVHFEAIFYLNDSKQVNIFDLLSARKNKKEQMKMDKLSIYSAFNLG